MDVGVIQHVTDLDENIEQPVHGEIGDGILFLPVKRNEDLVEVPARHLLHGEVKFAILLVADLVHRNRAGMLELGGQAGLAEESPPQLAVVGVPGLQLLHRYRASQGGVAAGEDIRPAPLPHRLEIRVLVETVLKTGRQVHVRLGRHHRGILTNHCATPWLLFHVIPEK